MARRKPIAEAATNTPAARKADTWAIERVKPYEKNAKKHPTKQVEHLAKLIRDHGFDQPIVVDKDGVIIKGHGRLLAAQHLKMAAVPVVVRDDLTPAQVRAARIADNKVAEMGSWDVDMLLDDVKEAMEMPGFDLDVLGLNVSFINKHIRLPGELEEPEIPDPPKNPVTKPGDAWQLGRHTVVCGDCTDPKNWTKVQSVFTSPPYALGGTVSLRRSKTRKALYETHDDGDVEAWSNLMSGFLKNALKYAAYTFVNLQMLSNNRVRMFEWLHEHRHNFVDVLVWDKGNGAPQFAPMVLNSVFEFVFAFSSEKNPSRAIKQAPEFRGTVENIVRVSRGHNDYADVHGAVFPIDLPAWFMRQLCPPGGTIADPFSGTGTTLIAAEQLDRRCHAIEMDPRYVDVIVERWQELTGEKAKRV